LTDKYDPPGDPNRPADPWDGFEPLDPFAELKDLSDADPLPPLEDPAVPAATPPRSPILTGIIVALLLIVLTVAFFQFLSQDDDDAAAGGTTVPETTATPTTEGTPETTGAPDETTGTGTETDATQPGTGVFEPYEAAGEPVALSELTLAVDSVGPIEFGTPARQSIGRLIASLGEPDEDNGPVVSTGAYGTCAGETERIVRWGPFVAIVVVDPDGTETFAAYRLDLNYGDDLSANAVNLETLSGLKAGFSVLQLEQVYSTFDLQYEVVDDIGQTFQLYSANTGNLLLWGPVTSDESTGYVLGIYSPDACGRF
jgi:hypothetical protein